MEDVVLLGNLQRAAKSCTAIVRVPSMSNTQ